MSARLPDGATLSLATEYGANKVMSAVSNANPAIASLASGHSIAAGNLFELTSGWSGLNNKVIKAGTPLTDDIPLLGMNTLNETKYPPGSGGGTIREILTFTQLLQILGFETSGGEPGQVTFAYLEDDFEQSLPTGASAQTLKIQIADDASLAGYQAAKDASESGEVLCLKMTLKDGSIILYNGVIFLNETPTVTKGQVMAVTATFYLKTKPVRYAAP